MSKNNPKFPCIKAILLMGGTGERFGSELPKQFLNLSGKKIYQHTLEAFLAFDIFSEILLVCHENWIDKVQADVKNPKVRVVKAGPSRQASTYAGLLAAGPNTDFVVVHDAVRPFVSQKMIQDNLEALQKHHAVDTCIPSADTIVHVRKANTIASIPNRLEYLRGQTPQSFSYSIILEAHQKAKSRDTSDDCRLVLDLGYPVHVVQGSDENIKITSELDLFLAEQLMRIREQKIGSMTGSLSGKVFAITGGTGGIGSSLAKLLKKEGATPLILSTSSKDYPLDLTKYSATQSTFQSIEKHYGPLDALINCAGHLMIKPFEKLTEQEIDHLIQTNFHSLLYSCRCAVLKKGAHIVNLSSSAFTRGRKDYSLYSATKAAIVNFSQALAEERPDLYVNVVVPHRTDTPMRRSNFPKDDPSMLLSSEEVAQEIISLLKSHQTTGTILEVRKKRAE